MTGDIVQSGYSRPWLIKGGAGPAGELVYLACAKAGDPSWGQGDVTKIECPDPDQRDAFIEVAEIQGAQERVTTSLMMRYGFDASLLLDMIRSRCGFDFQVHIGKCTNPREYGPTGWQKIQVYPLSRFTSYSLENLGAIESGERNPTNEMVDISAKLMYEILRISFAEQAASTVVREIVSIDVCDSIACADGECGPASNGCQKVFAVMLGTGATPGTLPAVLYSKDGGATWASVDINTMFSNETPTDSDCMGSYLVILSTTSNSLHYATTANITGGAASPFGETISGFVAGGTPEAIWAATARHAWIVANLGYVYFVSDPTVSVSVQDAGQATTQNLRAVHGSSTSHVVAVGALNAIIRTTNGSTWGALTGPAVGVGLNTVWVNSLYEWIIGDAAGSMWYTADAGVSYTAVDLPLSTISAIDKIAADPRYPGVLYAAVRIGGTARILRSTAGGLSGTWYVLPENAGAIPDNDRINDLAVCGPNIVWGAGLGANASDGIIVKAS